LVPNSTGFGNERHLKEQTSAILERKDLNGCEVHMTYIPTPGDAAGLGKLGVNFTSDPDFATRFLFVR
jgi:uncharacterized protein (UPF0371 family)